MIFEKAYAKINLALEVMDSREDGFHEIKTIMMPLELHDEIKLSISEADEIVSNVNIKQNSITDALNLFRNKTNINTKVRIELSKRIPISAGLAGGSADSAAAIRGLNRLFNTKLTNDEMKSIAMELGSDIPYCIDQSLSTCTGRGEIVNTIDMNYSKYPIIIIKPKFGMSTKIVYQNYVYEAHNYEKNYENIINGLKDNDVSLIKENIFNDLSKTSDLLNKDLLDIKNNLKDNGITFYQSGSGPSLFIFNNTENDYQIIKGLLKNKCRIIKTRLR